jgi:hypothetical protein
MPQTALPRSNMPVVLRIILAILLGFPGIVGLFGFGFVLGDWLYEGFRFQQSDLWIMPVVVIGAESFICFSVLTVGVVLRYARWKRAPVVSLVLAILAAVVIVLGYQLILDCLPADDGDDRMTALIFSILGLLIIAVPPLLHWWKAKREEP